MQEYGHNVGRLFSPLELPMIVRCYRLFRARQFAAGTPAVIEPLHGESSESEIDFS
jgi:hypothetical protein